VALAVLGTCLLLARGRTSGPARALPAVLVPFAAVGSMALTAYALHVLVLGLVPEAVVEADPSGMRLFAAFGAAALLGCTAWAVLLGRGPLERAVSATARRAAPEPAPVPSPVPAAPAPLP
jgi:uncharacterized membrane protein YeiB